MSRSCPNCGSDVGSRDKFCNKCGYSLIERKIDKRSEITVTEKTNTTSNDTRVEYPPNVYIPDRGFWQKFFRISGRLNPMRFLFRTTIIFTADFLILLILSMMHVSVETGNTVVGAVMFVTAILMIPLMIRRSHDLGRSVRFFVIAIVVGIIGAISFYYIVAASLCTMIYFTLCPGNNGTNEYCPSPVGMTADLPFEDNKILAAISKVEEHEYSTFAIILVVAMLTFGTTTLGD